MTFDGPLHGDFYLTLDGELAAYADGGDVRLRVIGRNGYPHDVRVSPTHSGKLHAGRVFAPVVGDGHTLRIEPKARAATGALKILCANCFADIWSNPLPSGGDASHIQALADSFWTEHADRACPRCHAAAARAH